MRNVAPGLGIIIFLQEKGNKFDDCLMFKSDSSSLVSFIEARFSSLFFSRSRWQASNREVVEELAFNLRVDKASQIIQIFILFYSLVIFLYCKVLGCFARTKSAYTNNT